LLKLLNAGDYQGAAEQFQRWDHAAGQVVAGLLRRRLAEKQEFLHLLMAP
jgi:lysozyme